MAVRRVFIDWQEAALAGAVRWLLHESGWGRDFAETLLVTPGNRAARRLLELMTLGLDGQAWVPPRLSTPGSLPAMLCAYVREPASDLQLELAWVQALQTCDADALRPLLPKRPEDDDLRSWRTLARTLMQRGEQLAAENLQMRDVLAKLQTHADFQDQARWQVIQALEHAVQQQLQRAGLQDFHQATQQACALSLWRSDAPRRIVLVSCLELAGVFRRLMQAWGGEVVAMIHAPASAAEAFDAWGCPLLEAWENRSSPLTEAMIHVVDRPLDQVVKVRELLQAQHGVTSAWPVRDITIGLGDAALGPGLVRMMRAGGIPVRPAVGRLMRLSPAVRLLSDLASFARSSRMSDLAVLLRHPDLAHVIESTQEAGSASACVDLLDAYRTQTLQARCGATWLGDEQAFAPLKAGLQGVMQLIPVHAQQRRWVHEWVEPTLEVLRTVYGARVLRVHEPVEMELKESLQTLMQVLRTMQALGETGAESTGQEAINVQMDWPGMVEWVVEQMGEQALTPMEETQAIEMLGWLELALDDARELIVTGFNEGAVPESVNADVLLPDRARGRLGLVDNRRRYVRDLVILTQLVHSRQVTVIAGRKDMADEPRWPSRLMLACDPAELPGRVLRFVEGEAEASESAGKVRGLVLQGVGGRSRFVVPRPVLQREPLRKLRVTAFRDYLQCPYRFYLKHVLKLRATDDEALELDALAFGILTHEVLSEFAQTPAVHSADEQLIAQVLTESLEKQIRVRYGKHPLPAVLIQKEQLLQRLRTLAGRQAQVVQEGWRIETGLVEKELVGQLPISDGVFTVTGRIDRIDRQRELGWRIMDYKTSDAAKTPEQTHQADGENGLTWVDLQLPLYALMFGPQALGAKVELAYWRIPKQDKDHGLAVAKWTPEDLRGAIALATEVAEKIVRQEFWPPREEITGDEFEAICRQSQEKPQ